MVSGEDDGRLVHVPAAAVRQVRRRCPDSLLVTDLEIVSDDDEEDHAHHYAPPLRAPTPPLDAAGEEDDFVVGHWRILHEEGRAELVRAITPHVPWYLAWILRTALVLPVPRVRYYMKGGVLHSCTDPLFGYTFPYRHVHGTSVVQTHFGVKFETHFAVHAQEGRLESMTRTLAPLQHEYARSTTVERNVRGERNLVVLVRYRPAPSWEWVVNTRRFGLV